MQHRITQARPLLDEKNNIIEPGYATELLPIYNKKTDFKSRFHTKEWDYYYIGNDHFGIALTLDDNGYMASDSVSLLNFDEKWEITKSQMQAFTLGKKNFPASSKEGNVAWGNDKYRLSFEVNETGRYLSGFMNNFVADAPIIFEISLTDMPQDSMVIATPFDKPGHFYYNQKINCMRASGTIQTGSKTYQFNPEDSFGVLDWGRGIWTYNNTWYWSSLNTIVDGHRFGWNLGYGFGNTEAASENMLFYDGIAHKLETVNFGLPEIIKPKYDYCKPWHFTSPDNRIDVTFKPVLDRASNTNALIIQSDQHQVFGKFYGKCLLDDGKEVTLNGQMGFAEKVKNRW